MIAQQELADRLGISRSALASHISSLMRQGYVQGRGYVLREGPYAVVIGGANMDICGCSHDNLRIGDSNPGSRCAPPPAGWGATSPRTWRGSAPTPGC